MGTKLHVWRRCYEVPQGMYSKWPMNNFSRSVCVTDEHRWLELC